MAKLTRRRRRRPRRRDQGEPLKPPSPRTKAARSQVDAGLKANRTAELDLSPRARAEEAEADRIADCAVTGRADHATPATCPAPPSVQAKADGAGKPLAAPDKSRFSKTLGGPFGQVRIDTSTQAARVTQALGARAVTIGRRIGFAPGEYAPATPRGRRLLAHELVHTQQQRRGGPRVQRKDKTAKHGEIGVHGGLIGDSRRVRMNVIVREGDTLTSIAAKLVGYWTSSEKDLSDTAKAAVDLELRTAEGLAKALLVHHQNYLIPPKMPKWRAGLRLPLPMRAGPKGGPPIVSAPLASLWIKGFKPTWAPALEMKAGKAVPQTALNEEDQAFLKRFPDSLGSLLATKAITNAPEALPLIEPKLKPADLAAGGLAIKLMNWLTNLQIEMLAGQPEGQTIISLIRKAVTKDKDKLKAADPDGYTRTMNMLGKTTGAFSKESVEKLRKAYLAQTGKHCMTACYMGVGQLYDAKEQKKLQNEVKRKDRAKPKVDLKHVITIMETMQEMGHAGKPMVFRQKIGTTKFDKDPDAAIRAIAAERKDQPGHYFFGMSVVTGVHTALLALDLTTPSSPKLILLDQSRSKVNKDIMGKLADILREYARWARARKPKYSPLETKIWPLYPPSRLILPLD